MHHVYDETPLETTKQEYLAAMDTPTSSIYDTHVGKVSTSVKYDKEQTDLSQYRQRGYKVGSLMTGENDPDMYYKQPGHPLSEDADEKGGRFKVMWSYSCDVKRYAILNAAMVSRVLSHSAFEVCQRLGCNRHESWIEK